MSKLIIKKALKTDLEAILELYLELESDSGAIVDLNKAEHIFENRSSKESKERRW